MSVHQQKTVSLMLDISLAMHNHLQFVCSEESIPMNVFITKAIEKEFEAHEERIDEDAVDQAEKDLREHGTISLAEMDKAMGI